MAYGLKYTSSFDSLKGEGYTVDIYQKDYVGSSTNILLGGNPVVHKWDDDNPHAAIKGSTCEIEIINNGVISLVDLYSNEDDTFKITVTHDSLGVVFTGFMLQEESSELEVDYNHAIRVVASDGLGTLKDIDLLTASRNLGEPTNFTRNISTSGDQVFVSGTPFGEPGQVLIISGGTGVDGRYVIDRVTNPLGVFTIYITSVFGASVTFSGATLTIITPVDISGRLKYSEIIPLCLKSTGLYLSSFVYSKLIPNDYVVGRLLESTLVDCKTFLSGEKWDSCYDVLSKILSTFNATIFQAGGSWHIIRWDELRYQSNGITWYAYDSDFVYSILTGTLSREFTYGNGSDIATGLLSSLVRPYRFDKRTFKYQRPDDILLNANLDVLGDLITTYTSGAETIYEYEMPYWTNNLSSNIDWFIRVVKDSTGTELRRFAVVKANTSTPPVGRVISSPVEVTQNDAGKFSFSYRTNVSQAGPINNVFLISVNDGTDIYYLQNNGTYSTLGGGFTYSIPSGDNSNTWHSVDIEIPQVPVDGVLQVYLTVETSTVTDETWYKDLRLEIAPAVNETTKIIGHIHTDEQALNINNVEDINIDIDDAPSGVIKGCQFLDSMTGVIQTKTTLWGYDAGADGDRRLGEITTFETLFWKRIPRVKLEGTVLGLVQSAKLLSILSVIEYSNRPDKWFIWGQMEIDYKNDAATGTLYEQWQVGEADSDLVSLYTFKYLYETK